MPGKTGSSDPKITIAKQNTFLTVFALTGSMTKAAAAIDVNPTNAYKWKQNDVYGFRDKLEKATAEFADNLHYLALDTVNNQKPSDNPALKIFMLKAWHPRYKAVDTSVTDDVGKEVMSELKKALREEKSKPPKPEEPIDEKSLVQEQVNRILESKTNDSSTDPDKTE